MYIVSDRIGFGFGDRRAPRVAWRRVASYVPMSRRVVSSCPVSIIVFSLTHTDSERQEKYTGSMTVYNFAIYRVVTLTYSSHNTASTLVRVESWLVRVSPRVDPDRRRVFIAVRYLRQSSDFCCCAAGAPATFRALTAYTGSERPGCGETS